jgi:hypothetical protein
MIIALVSFGVHRSIELGSKECSIAIDLKYFESAGRREKNDTAICAFRSSFSYRSHTSHCADVGESLYFFHMNASQTVFDKRRLEVFARGAPNEDRALFFWEEKKAPCKGRQVTLGIKNYVLKEPDIPTHH